MLAICVQKFYQLNFIVFDLKRRRKRGRSGWGLLNIGSEEEGGRVHLGENAKELTGRTKAHREIEIELEMVERGCVCE